MGLARSTFYDQPLHQADDTALVEAMHAIKDEFEAYGWRRIQAALAQQGRVVNHKKIKWLMKAHEMNARCRRRHVATTGRDRPTRRLPLPGAAGRGQHAGVNGPPREPV